MSVKFDDFLKEQLLDPEMKKEYDDLQFHGSVEESAIHIQETLIQAVLYLLRTLQDSLCHRRHKGQGNRQGCPQGIEDRKTHIHKELSCDTLRENDGRKYADGGQG